MASRMKGENRKFVNPFNKNIGRRTGKNIKAGKNIRVKDDGFENFEDYLSESDADMTREVLKHIQEESGSCESQEGDRENQPSLSNGASLSQAIVSQSVPSQSTLCTTYNTTINQSNSQLSQGQPGNRSRFAWLRNRNIGRRTGRDVKANKHIRRDSDGFENFDDYLSESDAESFLSVSTQLSVASSRHSSRLARKSHDCVKDHDATSQSRDSISSDPVSHTADSSPEVHERLSQPRESRSNARCQSHDEDKSTDHLPSPVETRISDGRRYSTKEKTYDRNSTSSDTSNNETIAKSRNKSKIENSESIHQSVDYSNNQSSIVDTPKSLNRSWRLVSNKTFETTVNKTTESCNVESPRMDIEIVSDHNVETEEESDTMPYNDSEETSQSDNPGLGETAQTDGDSEENSRSDTPGPGETAQTDGDSEENSQSDTPGPGETAQTDGDSGNASEANSLVYREDISHRSDDDYDLHISTDPTDNVEHTNTENTAAGENAEIVVENVGHENHETNDESSQVETLTEYADTDSQPDGADNGDTASSESLRLTQTAQASGIELAGNQSGSITRLEMSKTLGSTISFNKTKKRLSYSALELSEEAAKKRRSKINQANKDITNDTRSRSSRRKSDGLGHVSVLSKSGQSKADSSVMPSVNTRTEKSLAFEESTFVSLSTQSQSTAIDYGSDSDDDSIAILDDIVSKPIIVKARSKARSKSSTTTKTDKTAKKGNDVSTDIQRNAKLKISKSENKRPRSKQTNRRKTAHGAEMNKDFQNKETLNSTKKKLRNTNSHIYYGTSSSNDTAETETLTHSNINVAPSQKNTLKTKGKLGIKRKSSKNSASIHTNSTLADTELVSVTPEKKLKKDDTNRDNNNLETERTSTRVKQTGSKSERKPTLLVTISNRRKTTGVTKKSLGSRKESIDRSSTAKKKQLKRSRTPTAEVDNRSVESKIKKTVDRNLSSQRKRSQWRLSSDVGKSLSRDKRTKKKSTSAGDKVEHVDDDLMTSPQQNMSTAITTPASGSVTSAPVSFGSGVSFRVSRRSEILDGVQSGYVGNVSVEMGPTTGLTPCISRPGQLRKSKGRRVTICPDEANTSSHLVNTFRHSYSTAADTPLPTPNSTPVHFCEVTHSATPHPGATPNISVTKDRLIHPDPPANGLRRSQRTRLKPVQWFKNEVVVYNYTTSGLEIAGVKPSREVLYLKQEVERRQKRRLRQEIKKASLKHPRGGLPNRRLSIHTALPEGFEPTDSSDVAAYNPDTKQEAIIECMFKHDSCLPVGPHHGSPRPHDPYTMTKMVNQPLFSSGELMLRAEATKPRQIVNSDALQFRVIHGKVLVTIHHTTTMMETGDVFFVPKGNTYSLVNLRRDEAQLFYTIFKQVDLEGSVEENQSTM